MVLNFVKAPLRVIGAKFWPVPTNDGVAWSSGPARDWFWALLTAVKILVTARKGTPIISQEILPRHSQVDATFSSFVTLSPAIALRKKNNVGRQ